MAEPQGGGTVAGPGLFASLRSFWSVLLAILYTRLDLATTELQDQAVRVLKLVLFGLLAALLLHTAFFFAMLWILAAFWDTSYRLYVIGGIFAVYVLSGFIFLLAARHMITTWPGALSRTIAELRRDVEGLNKIIASKPEEPK
jgi:uncharacterized membrane protein YqjE